MLEKCFPRVCGDVPCTHRVRLLSRQFSPRMRGCSVFGFTVPLGALVFPAYAGMFHHPHPHPQNPPSFPRVCGDVPFLRIISRMQRAFSPRMRGCSAGFLDICDSPAVFPAYAGMFRRTPAIVIPDSSFPRVCGDVPPIFWISAILQLFSPRMRGCSPINPHALTGVVVFPAYAGMFRLSLSPKKQFSSFPRVCGDVPFDWQIRANRGLFSPRMRGCSVQIEDHHIHIDVFPAYAGMFRQHQCQQQTQPRFPRVCGDVPHQPHGFPTLLTFSPRMRGCSGFG